MSITLDGTSGITSPAETVSGVVGTSATGANTIMKFTASGSYTS